MARPPEKSPPPERMPRWVEDVSQALSSGLTVAENLSQCWVSLAVVEGQAVGIQPLPLLRGRVPFGLSVERVQLSTGSLTGPVWVHWEPATVRNAPALKVLTVYGLATGARATLTLLVKAE
jgi:hypothetical protein